MIFEHANYGGKFQLLKPGKYDTAQILIGDKMLSSALIPYGMSIRLFEQLNLRGESITLREDTPAIKLEWNDRASSMIVELSPVAFPTPGYAMKAADPAKAFGAVIGKALRPLKEGQGLIPILIALQ